MLSLPLPHGHSFSDLLRTTAKETHTTRKKHTPQIVLSPLISPTLTPLISPTLTLGFRVLHNGIEVRRDKRERDVSIIGLVLFLYSLV